MDNRIEKLALQLASVLAEDGNGEIEVQMGDILNAKLLFHGVPEISGEGLEQAIQEKLACNPELCQWVERMLQNLCYFRLLIAVLRDGTTAAAQ
jgi:hypothetical protein